MHKSIRRLVCSLFVVIVASLLAAQPAHAFKPAPPPPRVVYGDAANAKVQFVLKNKGWSPEAAHVVDARGKTWRWKKAPELPAKVVVDGASKRVVLLGGYGDACMSLGKIAVHDFSGRLLASFDLNKKIADLKQLSKAYTRICCPCRWIKSTRVVRGKLEIDVCGKRKVTLALKKPILKLR